MSHVEHTYRDGSKVRGTPEAVAVAIDIENRMQAQEGDWIAKLRAAGVKAAHPDDGWVHRTDDPCVHLEYPSFNDGVGVGDLIALGWGWDPKYRIVRVTRIEETSPMFGLRHYHFEEVARYGDPPEPEPTKKRWWRRGR